MLQQVQPIPLFNLRRGAPFWIREPKFPPQAPSSTATGFNEFYCDPVNGNDLNSGTDPNANAFYTSTNGNWNGSNLYIPTDGSNPVSQGVAVGQFASIYVDGATVGVYIARILSVTDAVNGAIGFSTTVFIGVVPTSSATLRSIKVGGAFKGPHSGVWWPLAATGGLNTLVDANGRRSRLNLKNNATYSVTSSPTLTNCFFQGYSTYPGDGGKATIDGGATASFSILLGSNIIYDVIFVSSDTTGSGILINIGSNLSCILFRVIIHGSRNFGIAAQNANFVGSLLRQCEIYDCNRSNTALCGAIALTAAQPLILDNCYIHDNFGSNSAGVDMTGTSTLIVTNSIFESNGGPGIRHRGSSGGFHIIVGNDFYNNGSDAIQVPAGGITTLWIRNNNFFKNTGAAIRNLGTGGGMIENNAYGTGSQGNGLADVLGPAVRFLPDILYPAGATPWNNPSVGDFTLVNPLSISSGVAGFTETGSGKTGPTRTYPDVGAAAARGSGLQLSDVTTILPDAFVGHLYVLDFVFSVATTLTLQSGSLPPGLSVVTINATEAQIVGTPTGVIDQTYTFTLRSSISGGGFSDAIYSVVVRDDPDQGSGGVGGG
jgi:hypothetical protein